MCGYVILAHACGCEEIFFDTSCSRILHQLNQINQAEAWQPDTINTLPFKMPAECEPGWQNTAWRWTGTYCAGYYLSCPAVTNPRQSLAGPSSSTQNQG
jgi:hypothetical protein